MHARSHVRCTPPCCVCASIQSRLDGPQAQKSCPFIQGTQIIQGCHHRRPCCDDSATLGCSRHCFASTLTPLQLLFSLVLRRLTAQAAAYPPKKKHGLTAGSQGPQNLKKRTGSDISGKINFLFKKAHFGALKLAGKAGGLNGLGFSITWGGVGKS